ncbi:MAG: YabP/YqfC family sporulation protein [Clostridia bacterium]|nr:YabP/YqfC family sporulation protein [Clostridia bacterium]
MDKEIKTGHHVSIKERKYLEVSGIDDVLSFDERSVVLSAKEMGIISLEGEGLRIIEMNSGTGEIKIDGRINGFVYVDKDKKKSGLFGKGK